MLKYVAIVHATDRTILTRHTGGTIYHNYMSPISQSREEVKRWLCIKLKEYPPTEYIVRKALIAFEEDESINAEEMLKKLLYVT